ncbi:hypothetical protein [Sphingobacterium sp. HMA12]|uniref:MutS-related protein n=1 Tax=Sphingobacterium sp. HMA12 TaxID=2050894 RepID=UPI000CEA35CD|nr:hypothetical protein [Sphingobacterium sp. HMA12]
MDNKFLIDEQTKKDLQLSSTLGRSVFDFFNNTTTEGGDRALQCFFLSPTTNLTLIAARHKKIKRLLPFVDHSFYFDRSILLDLERFLVATANTKSSLYLLNVFRVSSSTYFYTKRSMIEIVDVLLKFHRFLAEVITVNGDWDIAEYFDKSRYCLQRILKTENFHRAKLHVTHFNFDFYHHIIRCELLNELKSILGFLYEMDAYLAIAKSFKDKTHCFPVFSKKGETGKLRIEALYHLFHQKPVSNDILMARSEQVWFLTGANMAGKSSLIKSIAIAVYLAHIGFPVPALTMETDVLDGLFTSININDNIDLGYSHFYNEGIRLKEIADQLQPQSNALIILDELFKGTNNDDASQAIFEVMKFFTEIDGPFAIVSSHIAELAEKLKKLDNIQFKKLTIEKDKEGLPFFTYKISEGVAYERLGMWLLNKSGVFASFQELLK